MDNNHKYLQSDRENVYSVIFHLCNMVLRREKLVIKHKIVKILVKQMSKWPLYLSGPEIQIKVLARLSFLPL